jgi:hypothetical protein
MHKLGLRRRTANVRGCVNFPVTSKEYTSTQEGGMYVELWVLDKAYCPFNREYSGSNEWPVCCGVGQIYVNFSGVLAGTDKNKNKDKISLEEGQRFPLEEAMFPNIKQKDYDSISLLSCITLGSTGWSGYSNRNGLWRCKFKDLTLEGKEFYNSTKKIYGKSGSLLLVTWLDT